MGNTLKLGNGNWATKKDSLLAYNDENDNFKPLPFEFDRASSATVVNKDGLIETVGSDIPRIDFKDDSKGALLLEPQRTNSLLQSNQFDTTWINSNTTGTSGYLGLDGTNSAWLLTKTVSSNANIRQNITFSGTHTFSVYLKKGTLTSVALRSTGGLDARVQINLIDGTTSGELNTTSVKTESVGNDWWRCSLTFEAAVNTAVRIYPDSITGTTAGNIYIYGAQLEPSYPTSYIPTQGSTVTRLADACNNGGNEQVINSTEGVLYFEGSALSDDNSDRKIALSDGSLNNAINFGFSRFSGNINAEVKSGGVLQTSGFGATGITQDNNNKFALSWGGGVSKFYVNGTLASSHTSVTSPIGMNVLNFSLSSGFEKMYLNCKDVRVYNTALTDSELAILTTI